MNLWLEILLVWSAKTTVVALGGWTLTSACRRMSAAWRNILCRLTLVGILAVPVWMTVGETIGKSSELPVLTAPHFAKPELKPLPYVAPKMVKGFLVSGFQPKQAPVNDGLWLVGLYLAGAAIALARIFRSLLSARRMISQSIPTANRGWGIPGEARILSTGALASPAAFGMVHPVVLLPQNSLTWPEGSLHIAVRHESAHIQRQDWAWQLLSQLVAAAHWFNPAVFLVARELRRSAEMAADDCVLRSGVDRKDYAENLVGIAGQIAANGAMVAMARRDGLRDRIGHILTSDGRWKTPRPIARGFTAAGFVLSAGVVGAALEHGLTPDPANMSFGPGWPFYGPARLSNGDVVRLEYVQDWSVSPNLIFAPDGSPVFASVRASSLEVPVVANQPKSQNRYFRVSTSLPRDETFSSYSWAIRVPFATPWATYETFGVMGRDKGVDLVGVKIPIGVETTDLRIGIAHEPWRSYGLFPLGDGVLDARIVPENQDGWWTMPCAHNGPRPGESSEYADEGASKTPPSLAPVSKNGGPIFAGGSPSASGDFYVEVNVPAFVRDKEFALKAYYADASGLHEIAAKQIQLEASGTGRYPNDRRIFVFAQGPYKISEVELMARDYDWVTFKDVRCEPE